MEPPPGALRPRRRRHWIPALTVLSAVLLTIASIGAVYFNLGRMRESFAWVQHTDEVLLQASEMDGDVVEAESAERGYLLTGDDNFRNTFIGLREILPQHRIQLLNLVSDNPQQQEVLTRVQPLLETRLKQLDEAVHLGPAQIDAALLIVKQAKFQRLTEQIRENLVEFRRTEVNLLAERQRQAHLAIVRSISFAIATLVLALACAALVVWHFQRSQAAHRERELTTDLIHLSRLNVMGQTASMLAHELNQPLTASGNYLRAMLRIIQSGQPTKQSLLSNAATQSVAQLDRAREIIQRLRDFIKKGEPTKAPEAVGELFDEAIALLSMKSDGLTISTNVDGELPLVLVDKIQIEQVLINLMKNAIEAMEHSSHRSITLSAIKMDGVVTISVSDTGPGIPKDVADKLFQPVRTTKGSGMGMGLSICQTLINANGGHIWAETNAEGGASLCFSLPIAVPASDQAQNDAELHAMQAFQFTP
jgi:two-component system, LuxR family, sensor kinase FixL